MCREISYAECIKFIEQGLHITLYEYQRKIIKAFCEGKEIRTCRCAGRTFCAEAFGKYIAHVYDRNNYNLEPDVVVPYQELIKNQVLTNKHINSARSIMSEEAFNREYCVQ